MSQVYPDSVLPLARDNFEVHYERVGDDLMQIEIISEDSIKSKFKSQYYIRDVEKE